MNNKNNPSRLLRVGIYIRVSTDTQAKKGDSIGEQLETLTEYVNGRDDCVLHNTYIDDGISGQKLQRGGFTQLMDDVKAGLVDFIIFTKLDRWFRSLRHYLNTQTTLEKYGVVWLAVSQPFYDTTTPHGRAFVAQSMIFAELEAQNDSVRIKDVFAYKLKQGQVLSGNCPIGYKIENKRLVIDPENSEKAVALFKFYDRVGSLNKAIAFLENEYGIVMTQSNLKRSILTNVRYIGQHPQNPDYCPALIDRDLFYNVQRKLAYNVKSGQKHDYIFSGLVKCACCSHSYGGFQQRSKSARTGKSYYYNGYRCRLAYPAKRCSNRKVIYESTLEKYILENIKPLLSSCIAEYEIAARPAADLKQKRAQLLHKIEKLKELYVNDLITLDDFKSDKSRYLDQLAALDTPTEPEKDIDALRDFLKMDIDGIYNTLTPDEKRYLWRSVIKEILIDDERNIEIVFL